MYAIVDIETTGSYAANNGITELAIVLHDGNKIVDRRDDGLYVSLGGAGFKRTTQQRLSPFCNVSARGGRVTLNGEPWDGKWKRIDPE